MKKKANSKSINLGLFGSTGKMGIAIRSLLQAEKNINCHIEVAKNNSHEFEFSYESINEVPADVLKTVDVWIDFSRVEGTKNLIKVIEKYKTPLVCGTTGFEKNEFSIVEKYAKKTAVFWSSNMSVGLWTLRQAIKQLGTVSYFDFAIDEIHHTKKVDNPSGTAVTLQKDLEQTIGKKVYSNHGTRLGGVFGIHTVTGASQSEIIKLEHFALNRTVFAEGAIKAAKWLKNKSAHLYSMDDLMKNKN